MVLGREVCGRGLFNGSRLPRASFCTCLARACGWYTLILRIPRLCEALLYLFPLPPSRLFSLWICARAYPPTRMGALWIRHQAPSIARTTTPEAGQRSHEETAMPEREPGCSRASGASSPSSRPPGASLPPQPWRPSCPGAQLSCDTPGSPAYHT